MANNNLPAIKDKVLNSSMQSSIKARIGEKTGTFTTSVLDLIGENRMLQKCDPGLVIKEALKAAALDLPINSNLGFAYVIPYGNTPQFQMGYKGFIQLAIRTGQYKHLNAGVVYEGEEMLEDRIKGTLEIGGEKASDNPIGYFAYMQLINGFEKAIAWPHEKVVEHARRFSKSFNSNTSPWKTDFPAMALKTMIMQLVPKYGPMTIEMSTAMASERGADFKGFDNQVQDEINEKANTEIIDIPTDDQGPEDSDEMTDAEKAEIKAQEKAAADADSKKKPSFA